MSHLNKNMVKLTLIIANGVQMKKIKKDKNYLGSVVEWLKHRTDDQHSLGLGSKPTCAILLCPWERHFTAFSPAWWS